MDQAWINELEKINNALPSDSVTYFINRKFYKSYAPKLEDVEGNINVPGDWNLKYKKEYHNPFNFAGFILRKKEYDVTYQGKFSTSVLYHLSSSYNLLNILLNNFDYRKDNASRRRYGPGTNFSGSINYCYSCTKHSSDFTIFVCDVLIGNIVNKNKYTNNHVVSIDTGKSFDGKVYVKARDDEFYPKYILSFRC